MNSKNKAKYNTTQIRSSRASMLIFACAITMSATLVALHPTLIHAETTSTSPQTPTTTTTDPSKEQLQQELADIEKQIADQQQQLDQTQDKSETLQNKLNQLTQEQKKIQLELRANDLRVKDLTGGILETENTITGTENKITEHKSEIASVIQLLNEYNKSPIEMFLSIRSFSDFFNEMETARQLSEQLATKLADTQKLKKELEQKREDLEAKRGETQNLLALQKLQQDSLNNKSTEQKELLAKTKGQEASYQKLINENKTKAQDIRNRLYETQDGEGQVNFEQALNLAQFASGKTSVRAALVLAILTQETNLGKNIGTCNRAGDPANKSWKVIMKPERDQQPFLTITKELGKNPDITPVSCPMRDSKGNQIGWGGAMGPAQFIPSTWMGYRNKVAEITGKPANPWDIRDAMLAAAIKLKANGGTGSRQNEWNAAMIYFSGSTNSRFSFYGDRVMALADKYQQDIDALAQ